MAGKSGTFIGIVCGISAGALWGLVFLAPRIADDFGPLQLTVGRYLAYGAIAAGLLAPKWARVKPALGKREWWALTWLSLLGNSLYFVLLAAAVQLGGIAMTSLIIGFLPVAVTVIGSREHGAVRLAQLAPSLLLSAAGVLCIGWETLGHTKAGSFSTQALGLLCAAGALASWSAFAVGNSRTLARLRNLSAHEWSLLLGVATGAQALLLLPIAMLIDSRSHTAQAWRLLGLISLCIAFFASIIGNGLWNRMSRLLPLTMVGQMILFETLFALLYGFCWDHRLPTALEILAIMLVAASVLSCLAVHHTGAPVASEILGVQD